MRRGWKRNIAKLLAVSMIFVNIPVYGAVPARVAGGLCEHHTAHTEDCGYKPGTSGTPCSHEHTEDCYVLVENCVHEHTADCYPEESGSEDTATPSEADKAEPTECDHECSEESSCITEELDCQHEHSEDCGYSPAEPGTPCTYVCEICYPQDGEFPESAKPEEEPKTDADACICITACTEESINEDCPVCGAEGEGLSDCKGTNVSTPSDALKITPEQVQEMIDALPTVEEVQAMTPEEQNQIYADLQAAYDVYETLTEEEQIRADRTKLNALFEFFNSLTVASGSVTDTQTADSVAEFDGKYYTDFMEAVNAAYNTGKSCTLLQDVTVNSNVGQGYDQTAMPLALSIDLNGYTLICNTLFLSGVARPSSLRGPGTVKGKISIGGGILEAPITVDGNIVSDGVARLNVNGTGVLRVNGNIGDFPLFSDIQGDVTIICTGTCNETDIQDRVITQPKNITLNVSPEEGGSLTASGNKVAMDSEDNAIASAGSIVTLSATANPGYQFKEWQVNSGGVTISNDNTFTMPNNDVAVTAVFEKSQKPSSVTVTVQKGNSSATEAEYGDTVAITAAVAEAHNKTRAASLNQVDFFVGTGTGKKSLGTANVSNGAATISNVNISNDEGFFIGANTITAEYGGSDTLEQNSGSAQLTVTKAVISGMVNITGNAVPGNTLTANYTLPSEATVSYQWKRDSQDIPDAIGETYAVTDDDVGKKITVTVTATDANHTGSLTSDPVTVKKAEQGNPVSGAGYTINFSEETITAQDGYELAESQSSTTGEETLTVTPGTDVYVRKAETATHEPSGWTSVDVPARPAAPTGVTAVDEAFQGEKGKLTGVTEAMQYRSEDAATWTDCANVQNGEISLAPGTYKVRLKATDSAFASAETSSLKINESSSSGGSSGSPVYLPANGTWHLDQTGWWFEKTSGGYPADTWYACVWNNEKHWYHFNTTGYLDSGWFTDKDGNIYFLHDLHDGRFGYMYVGWHWIGGRCYYFNPVSGFGRLPYGALLRDQTTPDGYTVNGQGQWTVDGTVQEKR